MSWGTALPTIYMFIQWRLRSACTLAQPDRSLCYVICVLCIDCANAQADLSEHVNWVQARLKRTVRNAPHVDPDQMPGSVASDLGLHCLPVSILWDTRHKQEYLVMSDLGLHCQFAVSILWDANNNTACTNIHTALSNDWSACAKQWSWSSCTNTHIVPSNDPDHPAQIPI